MKYLRLMRIKHWIKNGLVFLPIIFSGSLFNIPVLQQSLIGFLIFGLCSSIVYIINDIKDIDKDRKHPSKCKRPIASGEVSIKQAITLIVILCIVITMLFFSISLENRFMAIAVMAIYLVINVGYSFGLKNVALVDITILVAGFFLRVLMGACLTDITISNWLYLTVIAMSFYLGLGKRRNELIKLEKENTRKVLKAYNKNFLDKNMYVALALVIVFYSLWSVDPITMVGGTKNYYIWTVPIVILICMRYSLIIEGESLGDPVDVLLNDTPLIVLCIIYGIIMLCGVYIL